MIILISPGAPVVLCKFTLTLIAHMCYVERHLFVYRTYHWFSMKFMSLKRTVGEMIVGEMTVGEMNRTRYIWCTPRSLRSCGFICYDAHWLTFMP